MNDAVELTSRGHVSPLVVVAALVVTGCGGPGPPRLAPVQGVVRQGDRPLSRGQVVFVPVPPHQAPLAFGDIQGDGRYTMRSANRYAGVIPGLYAVCVRATEAASAAQDGVDPLLRPVANLVPAAYKSSDTTPLRCDVPRNGTRFDIDLPPDNPAAK